MVESAKSSHFKKVFIFFGGLFALIFIFLASVPLWFDVDQYRPQLISAAQPFINGTLSVGKLSLSLWGKVKVKVDGLELRDSLSEKVLSAKSIYAEIPVSSLFGSEPHLTLILDRPEVSAVKDKAGNINLLKIIREGAKTEREPNNTAPKAAATDKLSGFFSRTQCSIQLRKAQIFYQDKATLQQTHINDIDVEMVKVSLLNPFDIKVNGKINANLGESVNLIGPLALIAKIDVKNQKGQFAFDIPGMRLEGRARVDSINDLAGDLDLSSKLIDFGQWTSKGNSPIKLTDLAAEIKFRSKVYNLRTLTFKVLGGEGKASGTVNLVKALPSYDFAITLKSVDLNQAASSHSEIFKNTIKGVADFQMTGRGEGFDPIVAKKRLAGSGTLRVKEGRFSTLNVGQMLEKGLGESWVKLAEKIPALQGKPLSKIGPIESEYEVIKSDFSIQKGVFDASNFEALAKENKGVDLKGSTQVNLETCGINARWRVIDTYNVTKVRDLSVEQGGVKVEHILAEGNGPVSFPVQLEGTCGDPKVNYEAMTSALIKVALQNVSQGVVQKAKQEITKKIGEELQKGAAKPIQDALKGIFGK